KPQRGKKGPQEPPPAPKFSARAALVELVLKTDQRDFFARNIANRMWQRVMGSGLVNPGDQMHSENAPSHPELLAWLARDGAENKYDLKRLIRGLVLSKTYSRSSKWDGDRQPGPRLFAVARLRALTPMQLATSMKIATAAPDQFPATLKPEDLDKKVEQLENSARGFASLIEQPRIDFQISVIEALLFSNSDRIDREFLTDGTDKLLGKLKNVKGNDDLIDTATMNVLGRKPDAEER